MKNSVNKNPLVSVCVPVYNAETYLRECIDSILAQTFTDFELLIVDDGSTDSSCKIIESYSDKRIRLIKNKHDFISTQNKLLEEARGKYIARIDNDDRMLYNRLQIQVDFMENHPYIDCIGGGMLGFGFGQTNILHPSIIGRKITMHDMINGNCISNPTTMIRRSALEEYHLCSELDFIYSDDYGLWVRMLQKGLHLENISDIITEYRASSTQVSSVHNARQTESAIKVQKIANQWATEQEDKYAEGEITNVPITGNKLTLIIPFLNENVEVKNTVESARKFAGNKVDIIVINDHSDDLYDYRSDLKPYNITYIYNRERKGVAASRDYGVSLCTTPYFLLLDAHMRFYDDRWLERITKQLQENDRQLLCSQTRFLKKEKGGTVLGNDGTSNVFGACQPLSKENYIPDIKWNYVDIDPEKEEIPIPAVLGAGYAASKRYWTYLRGLEGLLLYGSDEAYISFKVWKEGGKCVLLKDVTIGHIYRTEAPYKMYDDKLVYNHLLIASLIFPSALKSLAYAIARHKDKKNILRSNKSNGTRIRVSCRTETLLRQYIHRSVYVNTRTTPNY